MCTDYQCISVIKAVFLQHSQPASLSVLLPGLLSNWVTVWCIPPSGFFHWLVAPIRHRRSRSRSVHVCVCVCFCVCDVSVWLTQVRADRRACQPHAGLHSHADCYFHPRLSVPCLPLPHPSHFFSLHMGRENPPSPPPLLAVNRHIIHHFTICLFVHSPSSLFTSVHYLENNSVCGPCMSVFVYNFVRFLSCFFHSVRQSVG